MKRKRRSVSASTPVRLALVSNSKLTMYVRDGLGAMKSAHHVYIESSVRKNFGDSLDLDEAVKSDHEQENRWDYLLGHLPSKKVIALEPHSAKEDQISTVIKKRTAAREQLRSHMKSRVQIEAWLWVASGKVHFADTEKARLRLDQNGIRFVGTCVQQKHLSQL